MTFFAVITALLCIVKIVKLHTRQHPVWHQYVIFYTASLECTIGYVSIGQYCSTNVLSLSCYIGTLVNLFSRQISTRYIHKQYQSSLETFFCLQRLHELCPFNILKRERILLLEH